MRVPVPMEDAQASIQILCIFSTVSRLSHFFRAVPLSMIHRAAVEYDALVQ